MVNRYYFWGTFVGLAPVQAQLLLTCFFPLVLPIGDRETNLAPREAVQACLKEKHKYLMLLCCVWCGGWWDAYWVCLCVVRLQPLLNTATTSMMLTTTMVMSMAHDFVI